MVKSEVLASRLGQLEIDSLILEVHSWRDSDDHELSDTTVPNEEGPDITVTPEADVGSRQPSSRPKRTAALNGREIITVLAEDS